MKKILAYASVTFLALLAISGCKKEETTVTEYGAFVKPSLVAPANAQFLDVAGNTVELKWNSTNIAGNADNWDVYFGDSPNPPRVKQGNTSQSFTVTVEPGVKYYWRVIDRNDNGINTRGDEWSFMVVDPAADMSVDMSWNTDAKSQIGINLDPRDAVDMRLLIVKAADNSIAKAEDGSGYESFSDFNKLPDGQYLISADIYSTVNAGDFNKPLNIDITLAFYQPGIIDETIAFPKIMTNVQPCDLFRTNLVKITKSGTTYSIEKAVSNKVPDFVIWNGTDADYASEVSTSVDCKGETMTGLGLPWMLDWWGETVVSGGTLHYTISGSDITIPLQKYCLTTYKGKIQDEYSIQGTGTVDNSGEFPVYTIHYDFIQGGSSIAEISMDYDWPTPYFEAIITTGPSAKAAIMPVPKPNRK